MDFTKQFGPWAMITGASSRLGQAFAQELASRGLNIVLSARSEDTLNHIATQIQQDFGVKTRVIVADLSERDSVDVLYVHCADLDIGLIVSNAGASQLGNFMRTGLDELRKSIQLNISTHTDLARYFGDQMLERRAGRGGILFMSSVVALQGTPNLSVYAAAKAYILNFAEALHYENAQAGLHISVVAPGPLSTLTSVNQAKKIHSPHPFPAIKSSINLKSDAPQDIVKDALNAIHKNKVVFIPGAMVRIRFGFLRRFFYPRSANVSFWARITRRNTSLSLNRPLSQQHSSQR